MEHEDVSVEDNVCVKEIDILMRFSKHTVNDVEISICYIETNGLYLSLTYCLFAFSAFETPRAFSSQN